MTILPIHDEELEEFKTIDSTFRDVSGFCDALHILYTTPHTQPIDMERWKVIRVQTYKDTAQKAKHEYVVAHFRGPRDKSIYLKLQRRIQQSKSLTWLERQLQRLKFIKSSAPSSPATGLPNPPDTPPEGAARPPSMPLKKRALDDISIVRPSEIPPTDVLVDDVKFAKGSHIPLPKLAVLALTLNKHVFSEYKVIANNCYWFAESIVEVLKHMYHDFRVPDVPDRRLKGRWNGIRLYEAIDKAEVKKNFEIEWKSFMERINAVINNPNNPRLRATEEELAAAQRELARLRLELAGSRDRENMATPPSNTSQLYISSLATTVHSL